MAANSSELQRKIFSRYVNQKLALTRAITVDDVVEQGKTGVVLFNLIEVLSEVNFTEKYNQAPKLRVHSLDNCNRALKFAKDQGVVMKVFPQAENLVDGDEKAVLGLIWSIILKFMKFGDADESLNAKDALLMWVQNKTAGYEGVDVKDFKASIKDGVALGAVIHKHRPAMIDMSTLTPGAANAVANWKIVQDAAERYFGLEKYITPEDILKLDENSMVIYVSEYYYGIAEQRKVDLAARRIHKLVEFTKQNDELRARFAASAQSFLTRVAKVRETLNDRTIDNTLAGARAKIAQFYEYKEQDKASILADQLNLEALYNSLSMRLAHHKRPAFVPPAGTSLADMNATLNELEKTEQERNIALHAELNRQLRLVDINAQHVTASQHLEAYQAGARQALEVKEVSQSVAEASYQIRRLDAAEAAQANIEETNWADLQKLGSFLVAEKYEHSADVLARQSALSDGFAQLSSLAAAKRPVLLDDLAREEFREELRIEGLMHRRAADVLLAWADNSDAYLQTREHIDDIPKAKTQIGLLAAWRKDKDSQPVPALNNLGAKIRAAQYNGQYSSYTYGTAPTDSDHVADLDSREQNVAARWQQMDHFAQEKATWLEAELARETEKEALRVQFATQAADFIRLIEGKSLQFNNEHFGFTLAEVEGYQSTLQQAEEAFTQQVAAAVAVYTDTFERAQGLGVTSNIYTSESPSTLAAVQSKGQAALQARNQRYQETLARQRYLDGLCRDFAALVDPFGQALVAAKDRISASEGELEEQQQFVLSKIEQSTGADLQQLASIQAAQDKLDAEGVTNNIHTSLSAKDVHSQHRQYGAFLNAKKAMLEEMIEHKRLRGLTPDQFKEIEDNFNQFDADRDSNLNARELKTCLYSLGEEKRPKEIADIVEKWGKGGLIDYAGFREFMIQLLGDSDTKEEITNGFKLIARGHDSVIETAKMELVMDPSDIAFIISTTPQLDAGYDYPNWIEQVFSR